VLAEHDLEAALDSALRQGLTSVGHLERRLAGLPGRKTATLRALLDDRRGQRPAESRREAEVARMLVEAGLPRPVRQYQLGRIRFDLAWPEARIAVEFQSYRHHFGARAWRRDQARTNAAAAEGWLVFNLTEDDADDACRAAAHHVGQAYATRAAA
jgi:very-short-patch-repair endonuclease